MFNPPELAILVNRKDIGPPPSDPVVRKYVGQIVTVINEIPNPFPFQTWATKHRWWVARTLDGHELGVVEPCLQKLPPPDTEDEDDSQRTNRPLRETA